MFLQGTFVVQDCDTYDTTEQTKTYTDTTVIETIASISANDFIVELDVKTSTTNYAIGICEGYNSDLDKIAYGSGDTGRGTIFHTLNGVYNNTNYGSQLFDYFNLRFERRGTTLKIYLNDVLIDTTTNAVISNWEHINLISWRTKTLYYKNLKIKAL